MFPLGVPESDGSENPFFISFFLPGFVPGPHALTVIVGLGRVMADAHFLTDVVIGGLAAYLIVLAAR